VTDNVAKNATDDRSTTSPMAISVRRGIFATTFRFQVAA